MSNVPYTNWKPNGAYPQIPQGDDIYDLGTGAAVETIEEVNDSVVPGRYEPILDIIRGGGKTPIHIQKAKELGVSPKVLSSYVGVTPASVDHFLNKVVNIIGGVVYFSGPFVRNDGKDTVDEGYYKILIKTDEVIEKEVIRLVNGKKQVITVKTNVVIGTSGTRFASIIGTLLDVYGWFDFPSGISIPAVFSVGPKGEHLLEVIEEEVEGSVAEE